MRLERQGYHLLTGLESVATLFFKSENMHPFSTAVVSSAFFAGPFSRIVRSFIWMTVCGAMVLGIVSLAEPAAHKTIKVACVGDSITFGAGIAEREIYSYPAQLGEMLGQGWEVKNFGLNGHTLMDKGNAPYMKSNRNGYQSALAYQPDVVIIKLGTNDSKPENWKYKSDYVTDYLKLITSFRNLASHPKIYVCKPVPVFPERWGITDQVVREEILPLVDQVGTEASVPIIDLYAALTDRADLFPDKVHPNAEGAEVIAKTVAAHIRAAGEVASSSLVSGPLLPAFQKGARLLFIGDSITDMNRGRNERDRNHYLGHSYVFLVAGRLGIELADAQLDFYNRGISGNTVAQLKARWQEDAIDMRPDVLTILIGTNDVGKKVSTESFEADYRAILQSSRDANPKLKIVLLDPFVLRSGGLKNEQAWQVRRSATDQLRVVVARLAEEFDAVHIETQALFDEATQSAPADYWLWDGIHPLPQGHELIARQWVKATAARWSVASGRSTSEQEVDLSRDRSKWLRCSTGQVGTTDRPEHIGMSVDGNVGTKWCVPHEGRPVEWFVKLEEPIAVKEYRFTSANDVPARDPREWKWEGSLDGKTWVQLDYRDQQEPFPERQQERAFAFENSAPYRYYRLTLLTNQGDGLFQLSEIALSGVSIDPSYVIRSVGSFGK